MRDPAARVVVVGSFVQACCWHLEHLPRPGETALAPVFATEPAGKGLAVAVGCRRLGAPVDLLLAIGTDAVGDELLRLLAAEEIAGTHVHRKGPHSGHGAGLIDASGENVIAVYPGANHALGLAEVEGADGAIAQATLVYGQLEAPPAAVAASFAAARRHGVLTVLNPSPWQDLPPGLLRDTDVLVVNIVETELLLEQTLPPSREARLAQISRGMAALRPRWNGRLLVVTLGEQGSAAFDRDGAIFDAAPYPATVINTLGAGDAFSSGLCFALAGGAPVLQALRSGNACGAYAVGTPGILDGLARQADLESLLRPAT